MYQLLSEKCEGLRPSIVDFASRLVATPSPSLEEERVADLVEKEMRALLFDHVSRDEAGNVIAVQFGRKGTPTVLLNCHLDTVTPPATESSAGETKAPGSIHDGWLHGPGAADCKAGLAAAQIYAAALLKHSLLPLNGNVIVAATVAEQNGLSLGIRHLLGTSLPELGLRPDYAILGEPTGLSLYHGHDGWMEFDVEVDGANPFRVEDVARQVYAHLDGEAQTGRGPQRAETLSVHQPRFVTRGDSRTSVIRTACRIRGANGEEETLERVRQGVALVAAQSGDVAVSVLVLREHQQFYTGKTCSARRLAHAWGIEAFSPLLVRSRQALAAAACPARVGRWRLGRLGMGTAGSVLVREESIPTVGYGPGDEEVAHTAGERVFLDSIASATFGTAAIVHKMIGVPVYGWTSDEIKERNTMNILVLNCGSSSLKYRLIAMPGETELASGEAQRVGPPTAEPGRVVHHGPGGRAIHPAEMRTHAAAFDVVIRILADDGGAAPDALGHRVVHGGSRFSAPTRIDHGMLGDLRELSPLAPLHNPPAVALAEACAARLPGLPQVAVFDTAFHASIPPYAFTYALPRTLREEMGIRKYGFHGTSHEFVAEEAARMLGRPMSTLNAVSCHLGSGGASLCAIVGGKSVDNTMGYSPLQGLIMSTRCGDLDPALALGLLEREGGDADRARKGLNERSGVLGLSGASAEIRDVFRHMDGDDRMNLTAQTYLWRIRKYLGAYLATVGNVHAVIFTDSIGETVPLVRWAACVGLEHFGVAMEVGANAGAKSLPADVATPASPVRILVIRTNEELAIARRVYELLSAEAAATAAANN